MTNRIKESTIHRIVTALSPKRQVKSPNKGQRAIPRGITPDALSYLTSYLNNHFEAVIEACEEALHDINENPNGYYKQHRYDLQVVKSAIKRLNGGKDI